MKDNMPNQITQEMINDKIHNQFIKPTNNKKNYIGIEIEAPILNLDKEAVDYNIVHNVTKQFKKHFQSFKTEATDYDGNTFSLNNPETDDILCYDCSYNNIEFAMGPQKDLFTINELFTEYYTYIKELFEQHNHTLTGMGINPYHKYNKQIPIPSERYMMLYHHLKSYENYKNPPIAFHKYPAYGMFSSASQVQLDVYKDNLIKTINTFTKLEAIKALLFSNSVFYEEDKDITCYRDNLWEYSTHAINPRNIGMYEEDLEDIKQLEQYLKSLNMYCVIRNKSYINFPSIPLQEYYSKSTHTGEIYNDGQYQQVTIRPEIDDIEYLRPFKFINLTHRGTVEFRSVCTQPIKDYLTVAAFHLGLMQQLDTVNELICQDTTIYNCGYTPTQLRRLLTRYEIPKFIDKKGLYNLTEEILNISSDGLKERGMGEEKFLKGLYTRTRKQTNPGMEIIDCYNKKHKIETLIKEYGEINV